MTDHVMGQVEIGVNQFTEGCLDCGATGYRLRYRCPWYMDPDEPTKEPQK